MATKRTGPSAASPVTYIGEEPRRRPLCLLHQKEIVLSPYQVIREARADAPEAGQPSAASH
jgi:hypothetical protein